MIYQLEYSRLLSYHFIASFGLIYALRLFKC